MNEQSQEIMQSILEVEQALEREQLVLSQLLGKLRSQSNHHLVLQVRMGEVSSYLTSVTLGWAAQRVGFAADLPIFRESSAGSKRIPVDSETIETIQQRQPDWTRQREMTAYLAMRRHHKFPPLLLVGYQGWVYESGNDNWGPDEKAMNESLKLKGLEPTGSYWDLDDSETEFYALDGQHRLMAIQGLREIIQTGCLNDLDKYRRPRSGRQLLREEILKSIRDSTGEDPGSIHERIQRLMHERIGVEIVPAVCMNESYGDALRRLRQMFVDVNENAKVLSKSGLTQLDETNGFRVVARRLLKQHDLFKEGTGSNGEERHKVEMEKLNLTEKSDCYTTLHTLAEIVKIYLKGDRNLEQNVAFSSWDNPIAKNIYIRPEDSFLEQGTKAMIKYFDQLSTIHSHVDFIQGKPASELRASTNEGEDNILFRPMVQLALAEAMASLVTRGISLKSAFKELGHQEKLGQLKLTERKGPWFGVLCDPISKRMRRHKRNQDLCCRLFQYLLGGGIQDDFDREELRKDFAAERLTDKDNGVAVNIEGSLVEEKDVCLPNPWR